MLPIKYTLYGATSSASFLGTFPALGEGFKLNRSPRLQTEKTIYTYSLFPLRSSLFTIPSSLFTIHYSLLLLPSKKLIKTRKIGCKNYNCMI